jgi:hypothetical protein
MSSTGLSNSVGDDLGMQLNVSSIDFSVLLGGGGMLQPLALQANFAWGSLTAQAASPGCTFGTVTSCIAEDSGTGAAPAQPHSNNKPNKYDLHIIQFLLYS